MLHCNGAKRKTLMHYIILEMSYIIYLQPGIDCKKLQAAIIEWLSTGKVFDTEFVKIKSSDMKQIKETGWHNLNGTMN